MGSEDETGQGCGVKTKNGAEVQATSKYQTHLDIEFVNLVKEVFDIIF